MSEREPEVKTHYFCHGFLYDPRLHGILTPPFEDPIYMTQREDPDRLQRCGVEPLLTPRWDPDRKQCDAHDRAFTNPTESNLKVQLRFAGGVLLNVGKSLFQIVGAPFKIIIGSGLGLLRYEQLRNRVKGIKYEHRGPDE